MQIQILKAILALIVLCLSYPIALILAKYTKDEKNLYKKYFPELLWILVILAAIFYTLDLTIALTLTFMFLIILFWKKR